MTGRAARRRQMTIATVGFQGFDNIGDEAILTGIEAALAGTAARVTTVFSGPRADGIAAFPEARRVVTTRHLPGLSALRLLRRTDLLVVAGGGIFNDHWTAVIPRYAAWVLAARLAGARVAWVGVGVGPIRRGWLRWLTRLAARASSLVLVRDAASAELLGSPSARVIPDPSLFNPFPAPRPREPGGELELGLVVRAPTSGEVGRTAALLDAIVSAAVAASANGARPVVMTMAGETDRRFAESLLGGLERAGLTEVRCEALGPTPAAALDRLGRLSGMITVRLHGLLLGALAGVPIVPIAYDGKVRVAAERLGLGDLVVPLADVSEVDLVERLEAAGSLERRQLVGERVSAMRGEREAVATAVLAVGGRR